MDSGPEDHHRSRPAADYSQPGELEQLRQAHTAELERLRADAADKRDKLRELLDDPSPDAHRDPR